MTDETPGLTFDQLFGSTPNDPDSLFDRWVGGDLSLQDEQAVVEHLLGSSFSRDEAMLRAIVHEGAIRSSRKQSPMVATFTVAVRRVRDVLEVLADSLPALGIQPVPVRSMAALSLGTRSFPVEPLGEGGRLHVSPAAAGRFGVSVELPDDVSVGSDWVMLGEQGRMVTADPEDGSVVFSSVGPGTWSLERRSGGAVTASVELRLEPDPKSD